MTWVNRGKEKGSIDNSTASLAKIETLCYFRNKNQGQKSWHFGESFISKKTHEALLEFKSHSLSALKTVDIKLW